MEALTLVMKALTPREKALTGRDGGTHPSRWRHSPLAKRRLPVVMEVRTPRERALAPRAGLPCRARSQPHLFCRTALPRVLPTSPVVLAVPSLVMGRLLVVAEALADRNGRPRLSNVLPSSSLSACCALVLERSDRDADFSLRQPRGLRSADAMK